MITISEGGDCFVRDGKPFFYLADTVWSAFTNPTVEEWREYLDYRRQQGFNALQINILPQWDRSRGERNADSRLKLEPFSLKSEDSWDFHRPNEEYFQRAHEMAAMAVAQGFIPALVVLWCDFVKGTWASKMLPRHGMSAEAIKPYIEYTTRHFSEFDPVYLVSGDTDLVTREAVETYLLALETLKAGCAGCLTTMHLSPSADLPDEIIRSPHLDFYMYQSGHQKENRNLTFELADRFRSKNVKRPVVNGEPCYEGHGVINGEGRYNAFEVRRALWQSLLSGAKAGITYGAHGIWCWHRRDSEFPARHATLPLPWGEALRFGGAWDTSFARWIFEVYGLFDLEPSQALIGGDENGRGGGNGENIRLSVSENRGKIVFYAPYAVDVRLEMDLGGYECLLINLEDRCTARPVVVLERRSSVVKAGIFNSDVLFLAAKK